MSTRRRRAPRPAADKDVYRALGEENRRRLLDLLFERDGRTLSDLDAHIPEMTRFGVMKHLNVLERAGLVTTRKVGREKLHYLNPVPIRRIYERWVSKYAEPWAAGLGALKETLERESAVSQTPQHVYRVLIRTTPRRLWQALTDPDLTVKYWFRTRVHSTWREGAPYHFVDDKGDIAARGTVIEAVPEKRLVMTWELLSYADTAPEGASRITWEIEQSSHDPDVCVLTVIHDGFEHAPNTFRAVGNGWPTVLSGLKTLLETGTPLIDPRK